MALDSTFPVGLSVLPLVSTFSISYSVPRDGHARAAAAAARFRGGAGASKVVPRAAGGSHARAKFQATLEIVTEGLSFVIAVGLLAFQWRWVRRHRAAVAP